MLTEEKKSSRNLQLTKGTNNMQKIKIVTDTASDITAKEAKALDILLMPFKVICDDKEYKEAYDFSKEDFYKMLTNCTDKLPSHSQITPFEYLEVIEELYKDYYDRIIIVPINQKGSATFDNAVAARTQFFNEHPDAAVKIHIINVLTYSNGYGYPVKEAAKMIKKNGDADEALAFLENWFSRYELYCTVYDLKYAKLSGRVGKAAAIAGELLGIKPIISFNGGNASTVQKVRGFQKALDALSETVNKKIGEDKVYNLLYGSNESDMKDFAKRIASELKAKPVDCSQIGACISINIGPQVIAVGFLGEKRDVQVIY